MRADGRPRGLPRIGRRMRRLSHAVLVALVAITLAACTSADGERGVADEAGHPSGPLPDPVGQTIGFAPYIDVTFPPRPVMADVAAETGQRQFVLAFVLAGNETCAPSWGGILPVDDQQLRAEVAALRDVGGDVIVASGGAHGPYLENACETPEALAAAYGAALDAVGSTHLDVDLEHDVPRELVSEALAQLQQERGTGVTLTLEVYDESGLADDALEVVHTAAEHDVDFVVNGMVMNFEPDRPWSEAMQAAARSTVQQLADVWPDSSEAQRYRRLGLTPMIGRNDTGVVTTLADAAALRAFAEAHGVGYLGFWSLARDNGACPGEPAAQNHCSGISQQPHEFTGLFTDFGTQ